MVGVPDPIAFLSNAGEAWDIAVIAVDRAAVIKAEARRDELKAIISHLSSRIGSEVGNAIARAFSG